MYYRWGITVPHNTEESDPLITYVDLPAGEITRVEVGFAWGCAGLVHCSIWSQEHQVWPSNVEEAFAWNDYNVSFEEAHTSNGPTDRWSVRAWNDDVRHDHTIVVRICVLPPAKTVLGRVAESLFGAARRT